MEKMRSKTFNLMLYPEEDKSHLKALEYIRANYDYAAICHNNDTFEEDTTINDVVHKKGELKKTHYHVVLKFKNAKWSTALANELEIAENYIEVAHDLKRSLLYLIHYYDEDKYQYSVEDVEGTLKRRLKETISNEGKTESEKVMDIFKEIDKCEFKIDFTIFVKHIAEIGYWDVLRRSSSLILRYLDLHNSNYKV